MPFADAEKRKLYHASYYEQWRKKPENEEKLRVKARERAAQDREKAREQYRRWYHERGGKERQAQRKQDSTKERHRRLARKYGITPQEYEAMWTAQEGACKMCRTPEDQVTHKRLCVDHNHQTGNVRGLLCHRCNCVLGYSMENTTTLLAAIAYLEGSI